MAQGKWSTLKSQYRQLEPKADMPLVVVTLLLLALGLIMMYSAGFANALYMFGDSYSYIRKQLIFAVAGLIFMFIVSLVPIELIRWAAWPFFAVTEVMLFITLFMPAINDAKRWIIIGSGENGFTIQPSEFSKVAIILLFAHLIALDPKRMKEFKYGFLLPVAILASVAGIMMFQTHLSGIIIIGLIGVCIMFIGGSKPRWFGITAGVAIPAGLALLLFSDRMDYAMNRIRIWLNPDSDPVAGYQTRQSLIAIGSGGVTGLGIGNSRQKHLYLPEPQNDFIFAIICEEMGLIGGLIVILLFAFFIFRGISVALHAKTLFRSMVAAGITLHIGLQAFLNIAVATNTIPNTGISLPFFSSGGTSLLVLLVEVGLLISISRNHKVIKLKPKSKQNAKPALAVAEAEA